MLGGLYAIIVVAEASTVEDIVNLLWYELAVAPALCCAGVSPGIMYGHLYRYWWMIPIRIILMRGSCLSCDWGVGDSD